MRMVDVILKKREGKELSEEEIRTEIANIPNLEFSSSKYFCINLIILLFRVFLYFIFITYLCSSYSHFIKKKLFVIKSPLILKDKF